MRRTSWPVVVARTLVASLAATIANPVWPSMATAMGCKPTGVVWRRRPDAAQAGEPRLAATALHARTRKADRRSRRAALAAHDLTDPGHPRYRCVTGWLRVRDAVIDTCPFRSLTDTAPGPAVAREHRRRGARRWCRHSRLSGWGSGRRPRQSHSRHR